LNTILIFLPIFESHYWKCLARNYRTVR
jgi:hypothetical protein